MTGIGAEREKLIWLWMVWHGMAWHGVPVRGHAHTPTTTVRVEIDGCNICVRRVNLETDENLLRDFTHSTCDQDKRKFNKKRCSMTLFSIVFLLKNDGNVCFFLLLFATKLIFFPFTVSSLKRERLRWNLHCEPWNTHGKMGGGVWEWNCLPG